MSAENSNIDFDLIGKVLSAEASEQERLQLQSWIEESDANRLEFEALQQIWDVTEKEVTPQVDVDTAWKHVSGQTDDSVLVSITPESQNSGSGNRRNFLAWAASIALIMSVGLSYWLLQQGPEMLTAQAIDSSMEVSLPDGSMVTLAVGSKLTYPAELGENERNVALIGKGFFDVASDPARPFVIDAVNASVKVLGTRFEVNTDHSEEQLTVSVEEGSVEVASKESSDKEVLKALESCKLDKESGKLMKEDSIDPAIFFWKDRTVIFRRTGLVKASEILSGLFQKEIILEVEQTRNCEITANFQNEDIDIILEVIANTLHLELITMENGYKLKGKGC